MRRIEYKKGFKTETKLSTRTITVCCKGYAEHTDRCIPICANACIHGHCIAPETCECQPGWGGETCNILIITCPKNKWGNSCENDCKCEHNSKCDAVTGVCTCAPGWQGPNCDSPCSTGFYGYHCIQNCRCEHGDCDHITGACICKAGYRGPLCKEKCSPGTHGDQCTSQCLCQNDGQCDHVSGSCQCPPGWMGEFCTNSCTLVENKYGYKGERCEEECPPGTYGLNCEKKCKCFNGGVCDPEDGHCVCKDGWIGLQCETRMCSDGLYGPECRHICQCHQNNSQLCHPWTGECTCKPINRYNKHIIRAKGYTAELCHRQCAPPSFGANCNEVCDCHNGALCHHITGECLCDAGWDGAKCEKPCITGTFGIGCTQNCSCFGNCVCPPGYAGLRCERPCPPTKWGQMCQNNCLCQNSGACDPVDGVFGIDCKNQCNCKESNTKSCDHVTGECICKIGFSGPRCEFEGNYCPKGKWGSNCDKDCTCAEGTACDANNGNICLCERGWTGVMCTKKCISGKFGKNCSESCPVCHNTAQPCHHINGHCLCSPGYSGLHCGEICPSGRYGVDCGQECECYKNGGECNHITGGCSCLPGWKGKTCSEQCEPGYFGMDCKQKCNCLNGGTCRAVDGVCICADGPEGFYGNHCLLSCKCETNHVCDAITGCVCKYGFTGEKCDIRLKAYLLRKEDSDESNSSNGGLIAGIVISIVLLVSALALVMYYKRRLLKLKHELYVTYTAGAEDGVDQRHFDNPIYSQSVSAPNNMKNIHNNLNNNKSNVAKAKLSYTTAPDSACCAQTDLCGSVASNIYAEVDEKSTTRLKDNSFNPNIYHSIEDLKRMVNKKEPFYDEVKRRSTEVGEPSSSSYDHLHYDRPRSDIRPNYQRLDTTSQLTPNITPNNSSEPSASSSDNELFNE
ncbi:unnamed protein product [Medioppia subpectinata]|uniref:Uncharacterized protein n=1 Tax=Medioppia subpectinata TaxID=1979941 RepID=A0A7R9PYD0_9ACAR|nr:unnamed protein product [Medioppia subpectinata]CAG2104937.1 unnamed protein product [Medioppia subpectinata]